MAVNSSSLPSLQPSVQKMSLDPQARPPTLHIPNPYRPTALEADEACGKSMETQTPPRTATPPVLQEIEKAAKTD